MKSYAVILTLLIAIAFGSFLIYQNYTYQNTLVETTSLDESVVENTRESVVIINDVSVYVEIADTNEAREQGLSGRNSLGENEGMLFVFDKKAYPTFWMKDMLIPLDIIWIADGKITKIHENVQIPTPETQDKDLQRYNPSGSVDAVLEVNSGFSRKHSLNVGDSVILP